MESTLAIFRFIRDYMATYPWAPTLIEIAEGCGFAWGSSVVRHLDKLEASGLIIREPAKARGIGLTEKGRQYPL
jgi:SOS-response transcriptional repressor LexA